MNVFCDFDVQENLLAVMSYTDGGFCLIDIRKMGNLRNGPEEGIMMVLEPVLVRATLYVQLRALTISRFM